MKKKILIISYNFAPRHTVGAIRPTKLAMFLAKDGYEVDVVTVKPFGKLDHSMDEVFKYINRVDEIDFPVLYDRATKSENKTSGTAAPAQTPAPTPAPKPSATKNASLLHRLKLEYHEEKKIYLSKRFTAKFTEFVNDNAERFSKYDAMISSYGPLSSHMCAMHIKKRFPHIRWIADFRDPMVYYTDRNTPSTRYRRRLQSAVCKKADELVTISEGTVGEIFTDPAALERSHVIYNGFDRSDFDPSTVEPDGEFSFVCVGSMYHGRRDISVLFRVFAELIEEGKLSRDELKVKYAGKNCSILRSQAAKYSLEDCIIDLGMLSRAECISLQASARQLILPNWNCKTASGVLPGKFFEFMMVERPIISIILGDLPGSEMANVINSSSLGIAYEEANGEGEYTRLKNYIETDISHYRNGLDCECTPDAASVEKFDFSNTAKSFEALL